MQLVELAPSVCQEAATISLSFREAYQTSFDTFVWYEGGWQATQANQLSQYLLTYLATVEPTDTSHIKSLDSISDPALLVIVNTSKRTFLTVGMVSGMLPALAVSTGRQLASSLAKEIESESLAKDLDDCASQISRDCEELTALRKMVSCLQLSASAKQDFPAAAATTLPILLPCLRCEEVAFVSALDEACDATSDRQLPQVVRHGKSLLDDATLMELVEQHAGEATGPPIVKHRLRTAGVNGVLVGAIAQGDSVWGHLIAINPSRPHRPHRQAVEGFGSHETNMLTSAASILATHASNIELFGQREQMLVSVVRALVATLEAKDLYTRGHSERVALYAKRIATELELDSHECERIYLTGLLHDIGKIAVPDATLNKKGALTEDEIEQIRQHPEAGWNILRDIAALRYVLPGVLYHHERVDGKGYPHQLAGDDIPLAGRVLAVADAYDAMTSDRSYREGLSQEKAEKVLDSGRGTQWDEAVIHAAFNAMDDLIRIRETYYAKQVGILAGPEN